MNQKIPTGHIQILEWGVYDIERCLFARKKPELSVTNGII